jgi:tRNA uridine 5-carboxymethylaminomethyl modification enzyme
MTRAGDSFAIKRDAIARETERLKSTWVNPRIVANEEAERLLGQGIEREYALTDLLRRPNVSYAQLMTLQAAGVDVGPGETDPLVAEQVEIGIKYAGYIERQQVDIERQSFNDATPLPAALDYRTVYGLSAEAQQKLNQYRPETLGQASRISGITPAAVSLLLVHLKRGFRAPAADKLSA